VDDAAIRAVVQMPDRKTPRSVLLRFRHPHAAPIASVDVDGKPWHDFDRDKEWIALKGLKGTVRVQARY
jgi:hypothetical protein